MSETNPKLVTPWGSQVLAEPAASAPIGVFDSGVGGLTVARAIMDQLPHESVIYVGDTAHGPYGPLTIAQVRAHALRIMDELVDSGVKLLVVGRCTEGRPRALHPQVRYSGG